MGGSKHAEECENDVEKQMGMKRMFVCLFVFKLPVGWQQASKYAFLYAVVV